MLRIRLRTALPSLRWRTMRTLLFIEAAFAKADAQLAAERAHLTTDAAGSLARAAGVRRVEPFHFSPRYSGQDDRMVEEVMAAFASG